MDTFYEPPSAGNFYWGYFMRLARQRPNKFSGVACQVRRHPYLSTNECSKLTQDIERRK